MAGRQQQNLCDLLNQTPNRIYVIADAGLNHGGNKERALALVRAAKWVGADAVSFQTLKADHLACARPPGLGHTKDRPNPQEVFKKFDLPFDMFRALQKEAQRLGIELLSTAFDEASVDFLDELGVNAFKIVSWDATDRARIEHVARKGKPVLLSTGVSTVERIESAIHWMRTLSNDQIVLLYSVSPAAEMEQWSLRSIQQLHDRFGLPVGFSNHTGGILTSIVAASIGAQVIERSFMIENRGETTDYDVSMDAKQLKLHIEELRTIGTILGEPGPNPSRGLRDLPGLNLRNPRNSRPTKSSVAPKVLSKAGL